MELYNFFSETTSDKEKVSEMKTIVKEIKETFKDSCIFVKIIHRIDCNNKKQYTIIGQVWGEDTNVGDTDLIWIFHNIKYTYFDANNHKDNNINP